MYNLALDPRTRWIVLFAGILLAGSLLVMNLYNSTFAQEDGVITYPENGEGPVATFTATDPEEKDIVWSLATTGDAGDFTIENGVLSFKSPPDFESPADTDTDNMYTVTIQASAGPSNDEEVSTVRREVEVTVTNVDEAGTLTLSTLQPVDGIEVTTTLTDIDSVVANTNPSGTVRADDIAWKWAKSTSKTGAYEDIEDAEQANYTPKPADQNHYLRATATYTDPQGSDKTEMAVSAHKVVAARSTNTPPVFKNADGEEITEGTREVAENSAAGTDVGDPVEASDAEGDVLTYTLGGAAADSFEIDVATGQLRTKASLDTEGTPTYTVMVTATDPSFTDGDDSDTITVNIMVTNVDEAPKLAGPASPKQDEDTATTTTVATYTATDDEDTNADVVLTLSGADASAFDLTAGQLTFKAVPNFEAPKDTGVNNVYNITVVATDSDDQTDEMDVTVTVTNVDEAGTVTLSTLQPRIGTPVTATLTDIDGAVSDVKWMWERGTGSSLGSPETIEGAESASYTPVMADNDMYLRATATSYTDPQGSGQPEVSVVSTNMVEIDDTNKAPEFPDQDMETDGDQTDQERSVLENTAAAADIGAVVEATDPNEGDNLTYTLGGTDGASFSIVRNTGQLQTKAALDREDKDTYMVMVTATDPSGLSATVNVTIKITDVDEDPAVTGMASVRHAENTPTATAVATYMATDDDDDKAGKALTWSLGGADAADFKITNGVLTFAEVPNFEAPADQNTGNDYNIMVVATDSDNGTAEMNVTVTVTNVDEAGTLTLSTLQPVDGIEVSTTLTDIDSVTNANPSGTVTTEDITWKWAKSTSKTGAYTDIDGETEAAYTPEPDDLNRYLRATATYTDPQGSDKTAMAVTAHKVVVSRSTNTPPVFKDADDTEIAAGTAVTREVAENTPKGEPVEAPVAASDAEGDVLTYTLGGDDAASFSIDVATGQLRTKTALDREATDGQEHTVTVTATDPFTGTNSDTITVNIMVTNVDEAPKLAGPASPKQDEDTAITTAVATYTATDDEDTNADVVLTLSGADASAFDLTAGQLTFKAVPNFEAPKDTGVNNVYNITVVATDSDDQTDEMDVTVTVTNVDEAGTVTLSTLQPRIGIPVTATLTDIDGATSDVKWMWERDSNMGFNNETPIEGAESASYTPVMADNDMYLRATAMYTDPEGSGKVPETSEVSANAVEIDDTNKAPEFPDQDMETDGDQTDQERSVLENTAAAADIGAVVTATDPNEDNLTYTLGGTDGASFSIVAASGQLQTKASLDHEDKDTYMVTVTATDPSGLSATVNVTIKVTDVDEQPEIMVGGLAVSGRSSVEYAENATGMVATYTASGPNAAMAMWSLSGDDAGLFDISGGVLTFNSSPDFESPADMGGDNMYMVTVEADDGTYMGTRDVTVTVTDVEEAVIDDPVALYDADSDGTIDSTEVLAAVSAYFNGEITASDVLAVVAKYFSDARASSQTN